MGQFSYRAIDANGQEVTGEISATDREDALRQLQSMGFSGAAITEIEQAAPQDLSASDAQQFTEHLATVAHAKLPLPPALRATAAELPNRRVAKSLVWLAAQLEAGRSLDGVLESNPQLLPAHLRYLIQTGVRSGNLGDMLVKLVDMNRASQDLWRSVRLALSYPATLLLLYFALIVFVGLFVMPGFKQVYSDFKTTLPWLTQTLIWFSGTRTLFLLGIAGITVLGLFLVIRFAMSAASGQRFIAAIPLVGPVFRWRNVSVWTRLTGLLVGQGAPLPDALRLASEGSNDAALRQEGTSLSAAVAQGRQLSDALASTTYIPASLTPVIGGGERIGALPESFYAVSRMFESRARMRAGLLQSALPPVFLVLVGFGAFVMLAAIMAPLIELIQSLSSAKKGVLDRFGPAASSGTDWSMLLVAASGLVIVLLITAVIAVRMIRLARPRRPTGESTFGERFDGFYRVIGWVIGFFALLVLMGALAGFLGLVLWLASVVIVMMVANRVQESERRTLVWSLALASERQVPLPGAARAFAAERHDGLGVKALALARWLERGISLDTALDHSNIHLPNDAVVAVRMQSKTKSLGRSLHAVVDLTNDCTRLTEGLMGKAVYLILFVFLMSMILAFVFIKIVPEFVKIFTDFKTALPSLTVMTMAIANLFAKYSGIIAIIYFSLLLVLLFAVARYIGLVHWELPLVRRYWRPLDQAAVARALAHAVEENQSMQETLGTLANCYPKWHIQSDLKVAWRRVASGSHWCEALEGSGLLKNADAGVLRAAERVGNLVWALNETADRLVRRFYTRTSALFAVGFPLLLLAIAVLVAFFAIGLFLPLIELTRSLTLVK